jgi:O-methyltransferase domain
MPPEVIILELSNANVAGRALQVAAESGVADCLDDQPCTAADLAAGTSTDPDALSRILRLLEERGVFGRDAEGRWVHTEASRFLRSDHPQSLRAFARMTGTPFCWDALSHLHHAVRTGQAGLTRLNPGGWVAYLDAHPGQRAIFQAAMTAKAHDDIAAALDTHDFSPYRRICDVGGGHGHLLRAVLGRYPETSGVLFELPAVAAGITPAPRLAVVAGDFFTDPLPDADAYVLMNILHDWDDDSAVAILSAVRRARRGGGAAVLLLETVMPEGPQRHWSKTLDVLMLAVTGGRERTLAEYRDLLSAAGVDMTRTTPTATPFSIVEGRT